jgi:hypothetical protein
MSPNLDRQAAPDNKPILSIPRLGQPKAPPRGPLRPPLRTPGDAAPNQARTAGSRANRAARHQRPRAGWTKALEKVVQETAARLKADFAAQIAQDADARTFKKLTVRLLKQLLPPGPGRPSEESITQAMKLRTQRIAWKEVYPHCIPNHGKLRPAERRQTEGNLRSACRARRNARAKKAAGAIIPQNIAPPECSV